MFNNTLIEQDLVTSLRMKLKNTVYKNWYFAQNFTNQISTLIPTFSCEYDSDNAIVRITIDKNLCESKTSEFQHRKEFYMPKIHQALLSAYSTTYNDIVNNKPLLQYDAIELLETLKDVLNNCQNNICSYKMLDVTVLLDNTVIVYL